MKTNIVMPLLVANWKMNPPSLAEAKTLFVAIRNEARRCQSVAVVVAPPAVYLSDLVRLSPSGRIAIGAQSVRPEPTGAHTGEVSVPMVMSAGATYIIIGHSERRAAGIDDLAVQERVVAALKAKATPIVCVGETHRDEGGEFYSVVEKQLLAILQVCNRSSIGQVVIAYEPVWAIGSGQTPTAQDVQEMRLFIEKCIAENMSRAAAKKVRILYGGSVNDKNAATLVAEGMVDGFLVGGASLKPDVFGVIAKTLHQHGTA